jgi:hypothetical protein
VAFLLDFEVSQTLRQHAVRHAGDDAAFSITHEDLPMDDLGRVADALA